MSLVKMQYFTNSKKCTEVDISEVYISWNNMKWDTFGNVRSYNESVKKMCKPLDGITNIFLSGILFIVVKCSYCSHLLLSLRN